MTWKSKFPRVAVPAILVTFLFGALSVSAQRTVYRKSATGRVLAREESRSNQPQYRGNLADDEYEIHDLVNNERRKKGLGELSWDGSLASLARSYSRQMARESFFSHYDRNGDSVVERARNSNIRGWSIIGENLFFCEGYDNFDALAVRGWMNSPEHRRNILNREYNATGIGVAQTRDGRIYITQVFIRD